MTRMGKIIGCVSFRNVKSKTAFSRIFEPDIWIFLGTDNSYGDVIDSQGGAAVS